MSGGTTGCVEPLVLELTETVVQVRSREHDALTTRITTRNVRLDRIFLDRRFKFFGPPNG
jgi:hypothetical protein